MDKARLLRRAPVCGMSAVLKTRNLSNYATYMCPLNPRSSAFDLSTRDTAWDFCLCPFPSSSIIPDQSFFAAEQSDALYPYRCPAHHITWPRDRAKESFHQLVAKLQNVTMMMEQMQSFAFKRLRLAGWVHPGLVVTNIHPCTIVLWRQICTLHILVFKSCGGDNNKPFPQAETRSHTKCWELFQVENCSIVPEIDPENSNILKEKYDFTFLVHPINKSISVQNVGISIRDWEPPSGMGGPWKQLFKMPMTQSQVQNIFWALKSQGKDQEYSVWWNKQNHIWYSWLCWHTLTRVWHVAGRIYW